MCCGWVNVCLAKFKIHPLVPGLAGGPGFQGVAAPCFRNTSALDLVRACGIWVSLGSHLSLSELPRLLGKWQQRSPRHASQSGASRDPPPNPHHHSGATRSRGVGRACPPTGGTSETRPLPALWPLRTSSLIFLKSHFIYLFMAVLGLHCYGLFSTLWCKGPYCSGFFCRGARVPSHCVTWAQSLRHVGSAVLCELSNCVSWGQ